MRLLFVSGTRADFGKMRPLMQTALNQDQCSVLIFVTGMHIHPEFGDTWREFEKHRLPFEIYNNGPSHQRMEETVARTIKGISDIVQKWEPSHIVVHGDRSEALAGVIVGAMRGIINVHVEGGELTGTVDESLRHSITKLSNLHLVSNEDSRKRVLSMGEAPTSVRVIGSPELDLLASDELPSLEEVFSKYELTFETYSICIFHPVTTEVEDLSRQASELVSAMKDSGHNFVVIKSNNDQGSEKIWTEMTSLSEMKQIRTLPSMRFEHFVTLLKNSQYIIGNSSAGVREAPFLGVPSVNIGTRQKGRNPSSKNIVNCTPDKESIVHAIQQAENLEAEVEMTFGDGRSSDRFKKLLAEGFLEVQTVQKSFHDNLNSVQHSQF